MSGNVIARERVREGVVECPLCGRQIARPTEQLIVYSRVESAGVDTADAIECPACGGVTFVVDGSDEG
jgi:predicted RNA-binding Zn-ribbon protein involved in translation (DUF1610 family)